MIEIGLDKIAGNQTSLTAVFTPKFCRIDRVCRVITFAFTEESTVNMTIYYGVILTLVGLILFGCAIKTIFFKTREESRRVRYRPLPFPRPPSPPQLNLRGLTPPPTSPTT